MGIILAERLHMYQKLRGEAEQPAAPAGDDDFTNPTCCSSV